MKPLAHERTPANDTRNTRSDRVDVVVICSDDGLLIELGPILGDRYRTHTVDVPADIAGRVESGRWIGVIDVDSLPEARAALSRLELQHPRCPLILVASRPEEWAGAITRGAALAALSRHEVNGVRLAEAMSAAEARLHDGESGTAPTPRSADIIGARRPGASAPGAAPRLILAALGVAVLGVGGGLWLHHAHHAAGPRTVNAGIETHAPSSAAGTAPVSQSTAAAPSPQGVLELLSAARVAFHDQKTLLPRTDGEPRGDSALELYAQVLKQDPTNDEAQDGIRRLFEVGKDRVQADLANGRLDDATHLVSMFASAGVSPDTLHILQANIDAARPKWLAQRVQQNIAAGDLTAADQLIGQMTASGTDPGAVASLRRSLEARKLDLQLQGMAAQVRSAIQSGALLEPADDNARTRLLAMRTVARSHPVTLASQRELQDALIARAGQATQASQFDEAQRYLSAAAEFGPSAQLTEARRTLQTTQAAQVRAQRQAAAAKAAAAAAVTAAPAAAPAAPAPARPHYVAARPVRPLNVSYPDGTAATGYVIVEFTLEPDGTASNASVVESTPRGVFDAVALTAVQRGRYSAASLHGEPLRARILLRFKPN